MRIDPKSFTQRGEILSLHHCQPAYFRLGNTPATRDWVQIENASSNNPNSRNCSQKIQIHKDTLKALLEAINRR